MLYLSFFEGFGLPVLEAMSCGTPVICSNTSCFPEIVEELDVMVDPKDVKGVEDKIERIILDGQYSLNLSLIPDNYFQQFLGVFVGITVCLSAKAS